MSLTAEEWLEPLISALVPVPAEQPGICPVCRTALRDGFQTCFHCAGNTEYSVLPITMSIERLMVHDHLRRYKDGATADVRNTMSMRLAALVRLFFRHHADCIGTYDEVATVPSTRRNAPASLLARLPEFGDFDLGILRRESDGFEVNSTVSGRRVLLIDDTFTRGLSMFASATAIERAGGQVVGPVAIGRHVNPTFENSKPMADRLSRVPFDITRCCRCAGVIVDPPLRDSMF